MRNIFWKWFLIGFGVRLALALAVTLLAVWSFEAAMWYFADLPTLLFLALAEQILPKALFAKLVGGDPFYIPMNVVASLLWGGIFTLIPLTRKMLFRLRGSYSR